MDHFQLMTPPTLPAPNGYNHVASAGLFRADLLIEIEAAAAVVDG